MTSNLDCFPCILRHALNVARMAHADESTRRAILAEAMDVLRRAEPTTSPSALCTEMQRIVCRATHTRDPYRETKDRCTRLTLGLYPFMHGLVGASDDPLGIGVRVSAAGNAIDPAMPAGFDLKTVMQRLLTHSFAIDQLPALREAVAAASRILFLADNAGETVCDRVLIEALHRPVDYAVKGGPVMDDATHADAVAAGIDDVATIVETGSDALGTILSQCAHGFRRRFADAPLIIAKGQANFETLRGEDERVFFLLHTKCAAIAEEIGTPVGSFVLMQGRPRAA